MDDSLTCQRCHQPLLRDASVSSLSQSQYALLAAQLPSNPPAPALSGQAKLAALPPASRPAAAAWAAANPGAISESYVFLPELPSPRSAQRSVSSTSTSRPDSPAAASSRRSTVTEPPTNHQPASPAPSTPAPPGALAAKLDALLSSRTAIDHPLCVECTGLFQAQLQRELEELTRERDAYIAFEQGLRKRGNRMEEADKDSVDDPLVGGVDEWDALLTRRKELEDEEKKLRATLKEREAELVAVKEDEARVKAEEAAVTREEEEFLTAHAALAGQLTHLSRTLASAKTQLLLSSDLLQHLESKNVYNDAFQIGHAPLMDPGATTAAAPGAAVKSSVTVGTINGLRLGGRPTVDWDEINAAWGLVALCIDRLAAKVGCTFDQYKIVPLGSFSRIEEVGKGMYELYASSDMTPVRILQNRRFSQGLVALLDCLRQLVEYGKKTGRAWGQTSIDITKDKINGHSIRLPGLTSGMSLGSMSLMGLGGTTEPDPKAPQGNPDEQWTRACRSVLGVLKRILVVESEADRGT